MSRGPSHRERGLLLREGAWLVIQLDGGGRWRLQADPEALELLGRRVEVEGIRTGFDILDVVRIEPC